LPWLYVAELGTANS